MNKLKKMMNYKRPNEFFYVLNTKVLLVNQGIVYPHIEKVIDTNLSIVTIASAYAKDVLIEDHEFENELNIFLDNDDEIHRTMFFKLKVSSLKELIFETCKIYIESFKTQPEPLIVKQGFEYLYIEKVEIRKNDMITFKVTHKNPI